MSGIIGVPCNDAARYHFFTSSLTSLHHPPNTAVHYAMGSDRIRGRNNIIRAAQEVGAEWVMFLDDDQSFMPGLLMRLLSHSQPVVASLYLRRQYPFDPVAYSHREDDDLTYRPIRLSDFPVDGDLIQVRAAGTGGMLIRMEVFRTLVDQAIIEDGVWFRDGEASEDLTFCEHCRKADIPVYVDLQARIGHCSTSVIWPTVNGDEWTVGAQVSADFLAHFPLPEQSYDDDIEVIELDNGSVMPVPTVETVS